MNKYGFLTDHELDSLIALPIELHYNVQDHTEGYGTYFREYLRLIMSASEPRKEAFRNPMSFLRILPDGLPILCTDGATNISSRTESHTIYTGTG
jgi:hypothetical protein